MNGFLAPWLGVFPLMVGLFALSLFVFLAAVYLTVEARELALQEDFRRRALVSGAIVAVMALGTFLAARTGASDIYARLLRPSLVWIVQGATASYAIAAFVALLARKYKVARIAAMLQVGLILWGWGLSQFPGGGGTSSSMGTDWCNSRWTSRVVSVDLVSDATLQGQGSRYPIPLRRLFRG